jgi:hypothetical protein
MAAPDPQTLLAIADSVALHTVHDIHIGRIREPIEYQPSGDFRAR